MILSRLFAWLPDGRHWLELRQNPKTHRLDTARIHDAYRPHDVSLRAAVPPTSTDTIGEHPAQAVNLGIFANGNLNVFPPDCAYANAILHVNFLSDPMTQRQVPLKFPWPKTDILEWASSPDGNHIACMVQSQGQTGLIGWLRKHTPLLSASSA